MSTTEARKALPEKVPPRTHPPSAPFLPSALNVKEKEVNQARVNGGSNYDSLKAAKCLVIQLVTRMNGFVRFPLSLSTV